MIKPHCTLLATAAIILALLAGCEKKSEPAAKPAKGDAHDHKSASTQKKDSHEGHDHDHEGHDHESEMTAEADEDEHEGHDHKGHDHGHAHGEGKGEEAHADEVKLTKEAIARAGIRTETAKKRVISPTFTAPGRVGFNTEATAHVGAAISGRVLEIKAKVGDRVKAGDVLLTLDSTELGEAQSDHLLKIAAVQSAAPAIDLARSAHERGKALYTESQGITLTEVQKREAELRTAEAAVLSAKSAVVASQSKLRLMGMSQESIDRLTKTGTIEPRLTIVAPITGEVIDREVTQGELVRPEKDSLLILADLTSFWVIADIPESRLAEAGVGTKVAVHLAAGEAIAGEISYIAPQLDPATRTASARITVKQTEAATVRPGMFAQVTITSSKGSTEAVLAVPDEAIQMVEGGPAVFVPVEGEENTFAKRSIKIGPRVGEWVPVLSGLSEGDKIVVTGSFLLKADLGKAGAAHEH